MGGQIRPLQLSPAQEQFLIRQGGIPYDTGTATVNDGYVVLCWPLVLYESPQIIPQIKYEIDYYSEGTKAFKGLTLVGTTPAGMGPFYFVITFVFPICSSHRGDTEGAASYRGISFGLLVAEI